MGSTVIKEIVARTCVHVFPNQGTTISFPTFFISRTANIEQSINFYIDEHAYHSECYFVKGHRNKTNWWVLILNPDAVEWGFKMDLKTEKFAKKCRRHGRTPMRPISCEKNRCPLAVQTSFDMKFIWWLSAKTIATQFNNLQYFSSYSYRAVGVQYTNWFCTEKLGGIRALR